MDAPISNVITIKNKKSTPNKEPTIQGLIAVEAPNIRSKLNILDPNTFPKAISFSPFKAATTDVTSSGRDVPIATIVRPTSFSLMFKDKAIAVAESTTKLPPITIPAIPTNILIIFERVFISPLFSSLTPSFIDALTNIII